MQRFSVPDSNKGFTLPEMLAVLVILGILSAIAAPSLLGFYNRSKINAATAEIQGALQKAQRQAMRTSKRCTVTLASNSITTNCLTSGDLTLADVSMQASHSSFQFTHKGWVVDTSTPPQLLASDVTLVIASARSNTRKCLVLSSPLGLIRSGTYNGASGTPSANNCTAQFP